ncbi:hypothetical protein [Streptomonospora sp. PA3]|nr:hypothetical protein [Streptomonospora sp. PA3]
MHCEPRRLLARAGLPDDVGGLVVFAELAETRDKTEGPPAAIAE